MAILEKIELRTKIVNATIITQNEHRDIFQGEITIEKNRITNLQNYSESYQPSLIEQRDGYTTYIDASGKALLPGFIQSHLHLCQTSMRNQGNDLELLEWLKQVIWKGEAEHTYESLFVTAQESIQELIEGGTTSALTMETVHHTEAVIDAVKQTGFRAIIGKALMDRSAGQPKQLTQSTESALKEADELFDKYHNSSNQRIGVCYAPRFVPTCSEKLLTGVRERSKERNAVIHTHASENKQEIDLVKQITGKGNIEYLDDMGLLTSKTAIAHCVHTTNEDWKRINVNGSSVLHCPSANLKLGSGFAPIAEMQLLGVTVGIGADGAPCNNNLDALHEARLFSLLQSARVGAGKVTAQHALDSITRNGAKVLGLEEEIGSIEIGKKADLVLISLQGIHCKGGDDPISRIIFSCKSTDVHHVWIDGNLLFQRQ